MSCTWTSLVLVLALVQGIGQSKVTLRSNKSNLIRADNNPIKYKITQDFPVSVCF